MMDEFDYWAKVKEGDEKAFEQLFKSLWREMFEYVARLMQDRAEAQDIVQEIFTQLWEKRDELSDVEKVKPYLYQWSRHCVLNRIKEQNIREKHLEAFGCTIEVSIDSTYQQIQEKELHDQLLKSIDLLPDRMREVFYLSRIKQMTVEEIASSLYISEQTVRNQLNFAIKRLRPILALAVWLLLCRCAL